MSLTLLPITALLLLLSGVGTPAHAAGYRETIAALRRQLLAAVTVPPRASAGKQAQSSLAAPCGALALTREHKNVAAQAAVTAAPPVRAWERKQYRTRFGFAEGAYLAVGPPASAPRVIFG